MGRGVNSDGTPDPAVRYEGHLRVQVTGPGKGKGHCTSGSQQALHTDPHPAVAVGTEL